MKPAGYRDVAGPISRSGPVPGTDRAPRAETARGWDVRFSMASHVFLALYLAALVSLPDVQTALAGLTCLSAFAAMACSRYAGKGPPLLRRLAGMQAVLLPALAWALIVALQIVTGHSPTKVGNQLVVAICVIAVGLSRVPLQWADCRRWLLPAAAIGAIGAGLLAVWQAAVEGIFRPHGWLGAGLIGTGAIKFGDLSAMLALLAFVLVLTSRGWRFVLGLAGIVGGATALGLAQARGGVLGAMLALGCLAFVVGLAARRREGAVRAATDPGRLPRGSSVRRITTIVAIAALAVGLMGLSMHQRFADIEPQIERFQRGDAMSETGQRLALWQAAVRAGMHSPWAGVGLGGGFRQDIERQMAAGDISPTVEILYNQPHNEYLNGFAAGGIPGFLTIAALFWLPVLALMRRIARGADSPEARAALVVSASFAGFALTDSMFDRQITIIAFFLLSTWFLRMSVPIRERDDG